MDRFKRFITISAAILIIVSFTGCGTKTIEIPMFDGTMIEVETNDLSKEQVQILEQVASGEANLAILMQSGLFTIDELTEMGLEAGGRMQEGMIKDRIQNFSSINIDDLTLDGLTEEQVDIIKSLIAGETTLQEILDSGKLTNEQLVTIGVMQNSGQGQTPGGADKGGQGGSGQQSPGN